MKYMVPRVRLSLFVVTSNGLVPRFFPLVSSGPPYLSDDSLAALYTALFDTSELTFDDVN